MTRYIATIHVRPKGEVRDPQGDAIKGALNSLGLGVENVRTGKEIVVTFDAEDAASAATAANTMGRELLANPVIEDFTVDLRT